MENPNQNLVLAKPKRIEDTEYLEYIRKTPCLINTKRSDPHHLRSRGAFGSDYTAIPLAREFHSELEQIGVKKFEKKYNINVWREAHRLLEGYFRDRS